MRCVCDILVLRMVEGAIAVAIGQQEGGEGGETTGPFKELDW